MAEEEELDVGEVEAEADEVANAGGLAAGRAGEGAIVCGGDENVTDEGSKRNSGVTKQPLSAEPTHLRGVIPLRQ